MENGLWIVFEDDLALNFVALVEVDLLSNIADTADRRSLLNQSGT